MKQFLLLSLIVVFSAFQLSAQITILDFETPETTTIFEYFGSPLNGQNKIGAGAHQYHLNLTHLQNGFQQSAFS